MRKKGYGEDVKIENSKYEGNRGAEIRKNETIGWESRRGSPRQISDYSPCSAIWGKREESADTRAALSGRSLNPVIAIFAQLSQSVVGRGVQTRPF